MKTPSLIGFGVLILLSVASSPLRAQTDRNRPKPKTNTTREIGQPENSAAPSKNATVAPPTTSAASPPQSNRRRKVMVTDFDARGVPKWWGDWDIGSLFANSMITRLSNTGTYDVVERERMKAIIEEQNLSQDERFRQDKVTKIGQLLGADYVLFGYLTNFARKKSNKVFYSEYSAAISFTLRLVDVSSGTVVKSAEIDYVSGKSQKVVLQDEKTFNPNDPDFVQSLFGKAINESVSQGVQRLTGEMPAPIAQITTDTKKTLAAPGSAAATPADGKIRGMVAAVDGNTVIINRGRSQGVKVGDVFEVTRGGITDPETGRILRAKVIAELRITNIEDGSADAEIVSQKEKVAAKDSVVSKSAGIP